MTWQTKALYSDGGSCLQDVPSTVAWYSSVSTDALASSGLLGLFLSQLSTQGCWDAAVSFTLQKDVLLKTGLTTEAKQIFLFWPLLCKAVKQISFGFEQRLSPRSFFFFFFNQPYCPCFIISLPFEAVILLSTPLAQSELYAYLKSSSSPGQQYSPL